MGKGVKLDRRGEGEKGGGTGRRHEASWGDDGERNR